MTRNEAIKIVNKIKNRYDGDIFVDTLIALGILKVEEETMFGIQVKSIIKCLEDNGYCVYKKGGE